MTTHLILIRHGETEHNRRRILQGQHDSLLSELGRRQADLLAERFRHEKLDVLYSSPLTRAADTAQRIARATGLPVHYRDELMEWGLGTWENRSIEEVDTSNAGVIRRWVHSPDRVVIPGAETVEVFQRRACWAVGCIVTDNPGRTIGVVTHGGVISSFLCHLFAIPPSNLWRWQFDNAGVNVLRFRDGVHQVVRINDVQHLVSLNGSPGTAPRS